MHFEVEVEKVNDQIQTYMSITLIMLVTWASLIVSWPDVSQAQTLDVKADSAILVDADTGKILYAKNPDEALPPASMTKMMTEYLVWEAIESEQISWDTTTTISDYPYSISADSSFSGVGLRQNREYTVRELYEAMAINSDNATSIALAELIAGSEGEFVKMMNDIGQEMGLQEFEFVNSTGLDNKSLDGNHPKGTDADATNLLSARSAALLAYHLVNDYPEALEISKIPETKFDEQEIRNWNWMLPHDASYLKPYFYEGVDGLKTGYTDTAGFSFTGTAVRNGKRLITVVMKTKSEEARFEETAKLLDYGYNNFETKELFPKGYQLKDESSIPVTKGKESSVEIETDEAFNVPIRKGDEDKYTVSYKIDSDKLTEDGELVAPIKKGEKIGTAELVFDGEEHGYIFEKSNRQQVDLVTKDTVEKKNWFMLMLGAIGSFFSNLFSSIVDLVKSWF